MQGPTDVVVSRNTANDNVSTDPAGTITAGGIVIGDFVENIAMNVGGPITLTRNHCGYSAPNPDWCSN